MEWHNGKVCATYSDLTEGDGAIMKYNTLRSLLHRYPYLRITRGCQGKNALINYELLPERIRRAYEDKHGNPKAELEREARRNMLKMDTEARAYYEAYRYDKRGESVALTDRLIEEYTVNASVLNELQRILNNRRALRGALGGSTTRLWSTLGDSLEELREVSGHTLPTNLSRLKEKMNRYKKEGYASLISGKVGNRSATVIDGDAGRYIIALKRSAVPVYTDAQIFEEYNRRCADRGWKPLRSVKTLTMYLSRPEVMPLWWDAVHGELSAHQRYSRKNRTELPGMRDALWYGDGTKLNLYYKAVENGRTVVRTMQVYEVMDVYSEVLLGFHISKTEDYEAQYHAYRMAIQTSGHKPYELVCDNQGGHKKLEARDFFSKICRVYRPTAPYSGQSKTIESAFGRFQSQVLHKDWRFTGQNITAKKSTSRANMERIAANIDNLYTLEELKEAYIKARREWNEGKHPATGESRMEMYQKSENPETEVVTVRDMVDIFWIFTDRPSTYTDSGLRITVKGKTYEYEVYESAGVPDHGFLRRNHGRKFLTQYDPYDMRSVRLYTEDADGSRRFVCTAEPRFVIHRAIQEQKDGERAFIDSQIRANREDRLERQAAARVIELEHGVAPEQNGLKRPKLAGMTGGAEATEREINRRMKKYARDPEAVTPGELGKRISQMMVNPQTGDVEFDELRAVAKL